MNNNQDDSKMDCSGDFECTETTASKSMSSGKNTRKFFRTSVFCNYVLLKWKDVPQDVLKLLQNHSKLVPLTVDSPVTTSIIQAIGYNGMGKVTRLYDHMVDACGVASGVQTRINNDHAYKKAYWLARGDPAEETIGMSIVHFSRNQNVALFFEYCLEKYTVSSLAGESLESQQKRLYDSFKDNQEMMSLITNTDVQWLIACSLTKLLLLHWQTLFSSLRSIASFSSSPTAPCLHQQHLLSLPTAEEERISAPNLMNRCIKFKAILTTTLLNEGNVLISDGFRFNKNNIYMTSICINTLLDLKIDRETNEQIRLRMAELSVSYSFLSFCYLI